MLPGALDLSCAHEEQTVSGARRSRLRLRTRLRRFRRSPDPDGNADAGSRVNGQELEIELLRPRRPDAGFPQGKAHEGATGRPDADLRPEQSLTFRQIEGAQAERRRARVRVHAGVRKGGASLTHSRFEEDIGAGNRGRTGDIHLGKAT
jgi:hypothetical protein